MPYDIAIIGAGPAGATLARLLDKSYKILLMDRRDLLEPLEEKRSKCCGGLLAPDAQEILGKMGLAVPASVLVDPQLFLVRTIDLDNRLERYYQRFYLNMDRKRFDEWMVSLVPDNVDLALGCRFTSLAEAKEGYQFAFIHGNRIYTETAKVIVGADGAWSNVRRQVYHGMDTARKYIAIQEWYASDEGIPFYGAIFDRETTDFYSWIISKDGYMILGSALEPSRHADERFKGLKSKLKDYGFRFDKPIRREGCYLLRPSMGKGFVIGNDNVALVGEAGGFISPSSAEGISYAIKSAIALAGSLNDGIEGFGKRYWAALRPLRSNILLKQLKSPAMYNKGLRRLIMGSGIKSSRLITRK
jgi:geranylgeranyl reductase